MQSEDVNELVNALKNPNVSSVETLNSELERLMNHPYLSNKNVRQFLHDLKKYHCNSQAGGALGAPGEPPSPDEMQLLVAILLLAGAYATPILIDFCDYLTGKPGAGGNQGGGKRTRVARRKNRKAKRATRRK